MHPYKERIRICHAGFQGLSWIKRLITWIEEVLKVKIEWGPELIGIFF